MYTARRLTWRRLNMEWLALWLTLMLGTPETAALSAGAVGKGTVVDRSAKGLVKSNPDVTVSEGGVDIPPK
jgi:hypothetical protein